VAVSPDGMRLASGDGSGELRIWNALERLTLVPSLGPVTNSSVPTFSPDGKVFAVRRSGGGGIGGRVEIRNVAPVSRARFLDHRPSEVSAMTFSPDSRTVATACSLYDRESHRVTHEIRLWDLESGHVVRPIPGFKGWTFQLAFSPDGTVLAVATRPEFDRVTRSWRPQEIKLLDVTTGKERRSLPGTSMAFSPDGRTLAVVANDQTLKLMDWAQGRELLSLKSQGSPGEVSFSRDGKKLFFDGAVRDVASGNEICRLKGGDPFTVFSPDGKRLFSVAESSTVSGILRVWDAATGDLLLAAQVPGRRLAVHPDGWRCAVVSSSYGLMSGLWFVDAHPLTPELRVQHQAQGIVAYLFRRHILKEDVLPVLREMRTISEPVRQAALALAQQLENDALLINNACTELTVASDRTPEEYQRALKWAEEGARLVPDEGFIVQNVGCALYRVGRYKEAAAMCQRTYEFNRRTGTGETQYDLLFLAMAEYKLGRHEEARATFKRVPVLDLWHNAWREAKELIEGKANEPKK
jgi:WD40 repeat protein